MDYRRLNRLLVLTAVIVTILASCKKSDPPSLDIDPCGIDFNTTLHYLAIGDGFANGTTAEPDSTVGFYVKRSLEQTNHVVTDFQEIYVDTGDAVDLYLEVDAQDPECKNLVTVIVGFNDVLQSVPAETFRTTYRALLQKSIVLARSSSRVTSMIIPDISVLPGLPQSAGTPQEVQSRISEYNAVMTEECQALEVNLADASPLTNAIFSAGLGYETVANGGDDLHPDLLTIKAWANTIALYVSEGI